MHWEAAGACEVPRQSPILQFLLPYVDLTSPLSFRYTPCVSNSMKPNKDTVSKVDHIIHLLNSLDACNPAVCGVRAWSLLYITVPGQAEVEFSLTDLLQGSLLLVC